MKIIDAKNIPTMKNVHQVKAGTIYDTEHAVAVHITLEAGEELKPHVTPVDVFFYVLEGEPTFEIGKERATAADHLIESPEKIPHCIYRGSEQFHVLKNNNLRRATSSNTSQICFGKEVVQRNSLAHIERN